MKTKLLLISCMTLMCTGAFGAEDCTSPSNLCYEINTQYYKDGTLLKKGYYYSNGYGEKTYVDTVWIAGCADGYYMPTNAPSPKCKGGATTLNAIAIDECCWPCPFLDQDESFQECYREIYGEGAYVPKCEYDWCRGSVSGKDPYGGIQTCLITPKDLSDLPIGGDKTGDYVMKGTCRFTGSQKDVDAKCTCYPRGTYGYESCGPDL